MWHNIKFAGCECHIRLIDMFWDANESQEACSFNGPHLSEVYFNYVGQKCLTEECMLARLVGLEEERVSLLLE